MFLKILTFHVFLVCFVSGDISGNMKVIGRVLDKCAAKEKMFKCLKIQVLRVADRALKTKNLEIMDGVSLVSNGRQAKSLKLSTNDTKLEKLNDEQLEGLIGETTSR